MESVLHIEPITRQIPAPLHVGHTDHMFYGESLTIDDENVGDVTSHIALGAPFDIDNRNGPPVLGAPLSAYDNGSPSVHVPLVKTIEFMPDFSRKEGIVFLETTHYLKDRKFLVPFRSKIRSGLGNGLRLSHLPSLNLARYSITGMNQQICDPRSEIISDVLLRDEIFRRRQNNVLSDWLTHELSPVLDRKPFTQLTFDSDDINNMIPRYIDQVRSTPCEYNQRDLKAITEIICPFLPNDERIIPNTFHSMDPIVHHIRDVRHHLIPNEFDFRSLGTIPISTLPNIDYNPSKFQDICDLLDCIPLTDFNVDMILDLDKKITFYQEHLAINRFGAIQDADIGLYHADSVIKDYFDGDTLNEILERFAKFHTQMTQELGAILDFSPIKIKLIKTLTDEAAILLYRYDSEADDLPLCGVYFDIALQSLAPMSVIPMPIAN